MTTTTDYKDLVRKSRVLLRATYSAIRRDEIAKDYPFSTAICKAAIKLLSCLANASASRERTYQNRGLAFARSCTSEMRELVEAAIDNEFLQEEGGNLATKIEQMDAALAAVQGTLDAMFDR